MLYIVEGWTSLSQLGGYNCNFILLPGMLLIVQQLNVMTEVVVHSKSCNIDCTEQEHHAKMPVHLPLKSHKRERNMKRYSYRSRHSQLCWTSLHHVKSWQSAVAPATQLQWQVRNVSWQLVCVDAHFLGKSMPLSSLSSYFLISAKGDLYTWGWGKFEFELN